MHILFGILIAGLPLVAVELLLEFITIPPEWSRKLVHMLGAAVLILLAHWLTLHELAVVSFVFVGVLGLSHALRLWRALYGVDRRSYGEIAFASGALAACLLASNRTMFVCAIAVMGFADTAAALVGTHYGRHKIPRTRKSVEGSLAFIVVTMAVFGLCGFSGAVTVVGGSLLAAAAELVLPLGLDNLSITVVVVLWLRLSAHLL